MTDTDQGCKKAGYAIDRNNHPYSPADFRVLFQFLFHSLSATKFGSSPWQRYSSHEDADPQSLRSRKISSVKVDPGAPMNTLDIAQIVLSSMASTYRVKR